MIVYLNGLLFGLSLITALGPQNLFLIRQGRKRQHAMLSAFVCFCCDFILIVASVAGLHNLLLLYHQAKNIMAWAGSIFLFYYGLNAIYHGLKKKPVNQFQQETSSRLQIILVALGFSLLNPHAIIDSLIIIGGGSAQFPENQFAFILGVTSASFLWFTSLTYTTHRFSNVLSRAVIWQSIEVFSGLLMVFVGIKLIAS